MTLLHGQIVLSRIIPQNSKIVLQFSHEQKQGGYSCVTLSFEAKKPKKCTHTSSFTLKLWNDLTTNGTI